ncbi:MAG: LuxR C-terminal-related transcriptional regulator [Flavobacteriales bacterium]
MTPTEREVWRRIADPRQEKYFTIYSSMGISKRNFDNHLCSLFRKLKVHKRSGATRLWPLFGRQHGRS